MSELFLLLVAWHLYLLRYFLRGIARNCIPNCIEASILSIVFYYDTGIISEYIGIYNNPHFPSVFSYDIETQAKALALLIVAPGLMLLVGKALEQKFPLIRPIVEADRAHDRVMQVRMPLVYCVISVSVSSCIAFISYGYYSQENIWTMRLLIAEDFGMWISLFCLPLWLLAFHISIKPTKKIPGWNFVGVLLLINSTISVIPIGQRMVAIIPIVMIAIAQRPLGISRSLAVLSLAVILPALMMPYYKYQYSKNDDAQYLVQRVINDDFNRSSVLCAALEESENIGTNIMPYELSGYVYSALLPIPRSIAPFKGSSTATQFTVRRYGESTPDWGFGIGFIEEAVLNIGVVTSFMIFILYGAAVWFCERISTIYPHVRIPCVLSCLFISGYHLPAIVQYYVGMAFFCLILGSLILKSTSTRCGENQ